MQNLNKEAIKWLKLPSGPINDSTRSSERQQFEAAPENYLKEIFKGNPLENWPQHIIGFSRSLDEVSILLKRQGYKEEERLWNCLLPADSSNECSISIYRQSQADK